jgi:putative DNA primase/helicase
VSALRDLARRLGGDVAGDQVLCPGPPPHSAKDRSLSVKPNGPDDFLVFSFAGDDPLECLAYVRARLGVLRPERELRREPKAPVRSTSEAWRAIWAEAQDPRRTLVERYLAWRRLPLPVEAAGEALRFHPRCPFGPGCTTPAMIALVRDIRSNEPIGIHRTALDTLGHKREIAGKDRMALGPIKGGVVKFTPDEDVTIAVGIAEGIETTLSLTLLTAWGCSPIWACLSAGTLAAFPVLSGIETLIVGVDHDEAGRNAARQAIARWHEAGRETLALTPKRPGADLNDIIVRREA